MNRRCGIICAAGVVFTAVALFPLSMASAETSGRIAECRVESQGKTELNGPCRFTERAGGSFALENPDRNKPLYGSILSVAVTIVKPDIAEVSGLTRGGVSSRWGQARRSSSAPACWEGSDFKVCAKGNDAARGTKEYPADCAHTRGGHLEPRASLVVTNRTKTNHLTINLESDEQIIPPGGSHTFRYGLHVGRNQVIYHVAGQNPSADAIIGQRIVRITNEGPKTCSRTVAINIVAPRKRHE